MSYATIDDLRSQLGSVKTPELSAAYASKMLHKIPQATVVDRATFILQKCKGQRVLELGASGPMHDAIMEVALDVLGIDREDNGEHVRGFDLDDVSQQIFPAPDRTFFDVIVCGEILEHLSNPGWLLTRLARQYPNVPVIISVPNAFSSIAAKHMARGLENVNIDHCCWFSPRTLWTLLERHSFIVDEFHWYNGEPLTAEGIVVTAHAEIR